MSLSARFLYCVMSAGLLALPGCQEEAPADPQDAAPTDTSSPQDAPPVEDSVALDSVALDSVALDSVALDSASPEDSAALDTWGTDIPAAQDLPAVGDDTGAPPEPVAAVAGTRCKLSNRLGIVSIERQGDSFTASAAINDRPHPWLGEPALTTEVCGFYAFQPAFCEPACIAPELCGLDGACTATPVLVDDAVLTLTAGGLEQVFTAAQGPSPSLYGQITLPGSTFGAKLTWAGQEITLVATAVPEALQDLEVTATGSYDAPAHIHIQWTPPATTGSAVHTLIPINHHAGGPTFTVCAVDAAAGQLDVDGEMLKPLAVSTGLEFQSVDHVRFASAETPLGCVELQLITRTFTSPF